MSFRAIFAAEPKMQLQINKTNMEKNKNLTVKGLPNEEYHRGEKYKDFLSSSELKYYLISPAYAHDKIINQTEEDSPALRFGTLYHSAMEYMSEKGNTLDGWQHDCLAVFTPPVNPKTQEPFGKLTKNYKQAFEEFSADKSNIGKIIVASPEDLNDVLAMVNTALHKLGDTSTLLRRFLSWGEAEVSHFVFYEGLGFKYRPDLETPRKIIDWKTCSSADLKESSINRIIDTYGYGISAAFYQFFEHERSGVWKDFYWVFQSKERPYDAVIASAENWAYSVDDEGLVSMGVGAQEFKKLLDEHIYCTKNNHFPGAEVFTPIEDKRRILKPEPPQYTLYREFNFYN